jgi:alkanesulfonate monooxygenase
MDWQSFARQRKEPDMPIEFVGLVNTRDTSETRNPTAPRIDPSYTDALFRAHEHAGFDKVLINSGSTQPDGMQVAAHAAGLTDRLGFLVSHRPGFLAPTLAARSLASLDQFAGGRIAVHIITGGSDAEMARDGDHLTKDERYARTDEYLDILKLAWTSDEPFDYHGTYYDLEDFSTNVRSPRSPRIPLYFGGSSDAAYRVGGKHADVYAFWGEPLKETAEQIARVHAEAEAAGRTDVPGISVSFRPILAPTDELAWARAHRILETTKANIAGTRGALAARRFARSGPPPNAGSQRLLAAVDAGEIHDRCLWMALAEATGAAGNSTALVGTPETVAQAILDYVEIGVSTILIRGYDPYEDAIDYGRYLIPLVQQEVARRDALVAA